MFKSKKILVCFSVAILAFVAGGSQLVTGGGLISTAAAGELGAPAKKNTVGAKVGKLLKAAQELAQQKKFQEAMAKIKETQAIQDKTPYEEHTVNDMLAYVSSQMRDLATAVRATEAVLESGFLEADQINNRLKVAAQMHYQLKNYVKAVSFMGRYLKAIEPESDSEMSLMLAQSYYLQNDFNNSIKTLKVLIQRAQRSGESIREPWLKLQMSSYYELNQNEEVAATLEQLLARFPSQKYWQDLLGALQTQSGLTNDQNLAIYRLKFAVDALEGGDEYVELSELALQIGLPGDAKRVLEKGFAAKLLGVGPNKSRESRLLKEANSEAAKDQQQLSALDKEARAAKAGQADVKLGEAYISYGQNDKAIEALERGIAKGGIKKPDSAQLALGIAYLHANRREDAAKAFKAITANAQEVRLGRLWLLRRTDSN